MEFLSNLVIFVFCLKSFVSTRMFSPIHHCRQQRSLSLQSIIMVQRVDNDFNIIDALLDGHLFHVVEDIFLRLDCQSLTNVENAVKRWCQFIQVSGKLYHKKMATISSWLFINATKKSRPRKALGTTMLLYQELDHQEHVERDQ